MAILTYKECIEEDEQRYLNHADLHSNATAHFKAAGEKTHVEIKISPICTAAVSIYEERNA